MAKLKMVDGVAVAMNANEEAAFQADQAAAAVITVQQYSSAVQAHMDAKARTKNYDDIVSASSYAAVPNPFQAESQKFLTWRADCWSKCYKVLGDVQAGLRAAPTIEGLIAELPVLVL